MTPEQAQKLDELYEWMLQRKRQQISYPVDEASKTALGVVLKTGTGSATTQSISLTGNAQNISVPAQPSGTIVVNVEGAQYELLYK